LHVAFEEGTCAAWLHDLLKPHVTKVLVCDPRKNALLKAGSKNDRIDARSPIHFECVYYQTIRLPGNSMLSTSDVVFGRVVGIHVKDEAIGADGRIDVLKIRPIARLGYFDYKSVESILSMIIPGNNKVVLAGMDGSARG